MERRVPAELTSYVGRRTEIREAAGLLGTASLVTLTGPGGVGKTRLALRAVEATRTGFPDGVVFVELAELREQELLPSTVADRLGLGDHSSLRPVDQLVEHIGDQRLLLVLDNCEHLVEACADLVHTLLTACPRLVVFATSRQSLGVGGERVLIVPPLGVPDSVADAASSEAVQLFTERATAVLPSFAVTEENAADVVRLCRALDGLPLAIELATVRMRSLSVRQLADRLDERFTLLNQGSRWGPSRHGTLRSLIDWSHELCTDTERLLWARASVFAGGFDLDAAEEVCGGDGIDSVLEAVDGLVDKSILLREEHASTVRFRMLESVRQYGEDQLGATGDTARLRGLHRDWLFELTARFQLEWFGPDQVSLINIIRGEHANLRAALDFCLTEPGQARTGLRMINAIKEFWVLTGLNTEGRIWLDKLMSLIPDGDQEWADAQWMYAFLALVQGDMTGFEQACAAAEGSGYPRARAYVHHVRAYAALIGDQPARAAELYGLAIEMFREQDDHNGELWATYNHGLAVSLAGDPAAGRRILEGAVGRCVAAGEVFWRSWALWSYGAAEYLHGDARASEKAVLELLRLQRMTDDRTILAFALTVMAGCAAHTDRPRRAARLFGAATRAWQSLGAMPTNYTAFVEPMRKDIEFVTGDLGIAEAMSEFAEGTRMGTDEAVEFAIGGRMPSRRLPSSPLTRRETQVAELVARGMTNSEIAEKLSIARRTAESHVEHIRVKLQVTNRAQIAAWFVNSKLSGQSL
nr:LuxR C-terminal-related transcriptional regulator [Kibdelosporangium sp. MJ126-NF4]CEL22977.1 Possible protein kinase/ transcriptional regulator, LuxR family protein [Kibdelosporangium sp. MJ126-NF4]CTQ90116.1 Possible protein kinase/ transcriptional regulator, LuxR family protein [Kibdelosporangium sp. MJ126-NF4]